MTHYEILGVGPGASLKQIRASYRQLAKELHPDKLRQASSQTRQDSEERLKAVNIAYNTLNDPVRRAQYDDKLGIQFDVAPPRGRPNGSASDWQAGDEIASLEWMLQKLKEKLQTLRAQHTTTGHDSRRRFYAALAITSSGLILLSLGSLTILGAAAFIAAFIYEVIVILSLARAGGLWARRSGFGRQFRQVYLGVVFTWAVTTGLGLWWVYPSYELARVVCVSSPLLSHAILCGVIGLAVSTRLRRSEERYELLKEQLLYDIRRLEYQLSLRRSERPGMGL